jgi:hypothetical protein
LNDAFRNIVAGDIPHAAEIVRDLPAIRANLEGAVGRAHRRGWSDAVDFFAIRSEKMNGKQLSTAILARKPTSQMACPHREVVLKSDIGVAAKNAFYLLLAGNRAAALNVGAKRRFGIACLNGAALFASLCDEFSSRRFG